MLFEFLHNKKICFAFVNEKELKLTHPLIIYIVDCNDELGYELIFIPKEEAEWDTIFSIKHNHPVTFNNICEKLEKIFYGQKFLKQPLSAVSF